MRVQFADGPAGVAAPITITIPSDASSITIPLHAAADAAPGTFATLTAVATTTVQGQEITVRSQPALVDVQAPPAAPATEGATP